MRDERLFSPGGGCLLALSVCCFVWAAVVVGVALWMGWL